MQVNSSGNLPTLPGITEQQSKNTERIEQQQVTIPKSAQLKTTDVGAKVKVYQVNEYLNTQLPKYNDNLSANIVRHGGGNTIQIRNEEDGSVVKQISDADVLRFLESRNPNSGLLHDTYA